jgi:hypothetical protein
VSLPTLMEHRPCPHRPKRDPILGGRHRTNAAPRRHPLRPAQIWARDWKPLIFLHWLGGRVDQPRADIMANSPNHLVSLRKFIAGKAQPKFVGDLVSDRIDPERSKFASSEVATPTLTVAVPDKDAPRYCLVTEMSDGGVPIVARYSNLLIWVAERLRTVSIAPRHWAAIVSSCGRSPHSRLLLSKHLGKPLRREFSGLFVSIKMGASETRF